MSKLMDFKLRQTSFHVVLNISIIVGYIPPEAAVEGNSSACLEK